MIFFHWTLSGLSDRRPAWLGSEWISDVAAATVVVNQGHFTSTIDAANGGIEFEEAESPLGVLQRARTRCQRRRKTQ
jgi:hypothetical protein